MSRWEPNVTSPEPYCTHKACGGKIRMSELHITGGGGPDTDFCCSYWQCDRCGKKLTECRAKDRDEMLSHEFVDEMKQAHINET